MDGRLIVVIIVVFALVVIAAFVVFRQKVNAEITGPGGTKLTVKGSNEPPPTKPGVLVEDAKSRKGGLVAEDQTGRGTEVRRVETEDDILASSSAPEQDTGPKADPPA